MKFDRALIVLGVFAAALGGYLTHLHSLYPGFTEVNPFSAYHAVGAWYPAVKVLGASALYPLTKWCLEAWDRSEHRSRVWIALTAVLVFDLIGNLWVGGFSWVNHAAFELPSAWIAGFAVLSVLVVLYRDQVFRHKRSIAAGVLLTGVLLVMVPAVDAQSNSVSDFSEVDVEGDVNRENEVVLSSDGEYLYATNDTALIVYNESSLSIETTISSGFNIVRDLERDGNTLWASGQDTNGDAALIEFDVTNTNLPSLVGTTAITFEGSPVAGTGDELSVTDSFIYFVGGGDLVKFDGTTQLQNTTVGGLKDIDAEDDFVYGAVSNDIFVYNGTLDRTGHINFGSAGVSSVELGPNNGFTDAGKLQVLTKSSDPGVISSTVVSNSNSISDWVVDGDTLYMTSRDNTGGFNRIDISSVIDPEHEATNGTVGGVSLAADLNNGVFYSLSEYSDKLYRIEAQFGSHAPELTNGRPTGGVTVKPQPTLRVDVNDTDFASVASEEVNVSFYDFDSGDFIGNEVLTSNGTASVEWSSADSSGVYRWYAEAVDIDGRTDFNGTHSFTIDNDPPTLSDPTPRNDALRTSTGSITLNVDVTDPNLPDNDTVNVSWWDASDDSRLDSVEATSNGTVSGTWSSVGRGYHTYYVNATDNASNSFTTFNLRFKTPGQLSFFDASNGNLITDTLSVQVTGPGTQETITVSDGTFEWEDKTNLQDTEYSVQITSNNYATATFTIQDVALSHNIYLPPTSQDITFDLNDNSGNFPGGDTQLTIAEDITSDGDATNITAQNYFGSDDSVTFSLEQGETYELYVENTDTGDGRHVGTYTVPASSDTQTITISRLVGADWRIDDSSASPRGGTIVNGSNTVDLEIDITMVDSNDVLDVEFVDYDEDNVVATTTVSGSGTETAQASWNADPGQQRWFARVTDQNGVERVSNVFTFGVSGYLHVRNSTTGNLINTKTVKINVTSGNNVYEVTTDDGIYEWSKLPSIPQGSIAAEVNASGYFGTNIQLGSVAQNNTVYLTNSTSFTGNQLDVTFTLDDKTGKFPYRDTTLIIKKPVNVSGNLTYQLVDSGTFGATNEFPTQVESGVKYNLRINHSNASRELGKFETTTEGTKVLTVPRTDWDFRDKKDVNWNIYLDENDVIHFEYSDKSNLTRQIHLQIYEHGDEDNVLEDVFATGTYGEYVFTRQLSGDQLNKSWVVEFDADRQNTTVSGQEILGRVQDIIDVFSQMPSWLLNLIAAILIIATSLIAGGIHARNGALLTVGMAAALWMMGIYAVAVVAVVLAGINALAWKLSDRGNPV